MKLELYWFYKVDFCRVFPMLEATDLCTFTY